MVVVSSEPPVVVDCAVGAVKKESVSELVSSCGGCQAGLVPAEMRS